MSRSRKNEVIEIRLDFFTNPKTRMLVAELGEDVTERLVELWIYTAKYHPSGVLAGLKLAHIGVAAGFPVDRAPEATQVLVDRGWLDAPDEKDDHADYYVHDWHEHQPFHAKRGERTLQASRAAQARHRRRRQAQGVTDEPVLPLEDFRPGAARELAKAIREAPIAVWQNDPRVTPAWALNLVTRFPLAATPHTIGKIASWWLENPARTRRRRGCTRTISHWLGKDEETASQRRGADGPDDPTEGEYA